MQVCTYLYMCSQSATKVVVMRLHSAWRLPHCRRIIISAVGSVTFSQLREEGIWNSIMSIEKQTFGEMDGNEGKILTLSLSMWASHLHTHGASIKDLLLYSYTPTLASHSEQQRNSFLPLADPLAYISTHCVLTGLTCWTPSRKVLSLQHCIKSKLHSV
jgi:hypothetical protein